MRGERVGGDWEGTERGPWRDRGALLAMAPLVLAMLACLPWLPWYSNFDVDSMTWFEQVRSVAETGSVGFDNGPAPQTNTESATRWFVAAHGRIWGIYPAPLSYLLAPAMRLGGFRATLRLIWLFEILAAVFTFATVHRLTRRRSLSVGAAYALVGGTSWLMWSTTVFPFVPAGCFVAVALYARLRAQERALEGGPPAVAALYAALAGLSASLALGSHVIASLSWAAVGASFAVASRWRDRALHAAAFALASAPSLALMAWVNHLRFGAWSPLSYGPCNTQTCDGAANQDAARYLDVLSAVGPGALGVAALLWVARRSSLAALAIGGLGATFAAVAELPGDAATRGLVRALYGYVIDLGMLDIAAIPRASDGVGNFLSGWCMRSLLQCTPVFAAGALAARRITGTGPERSVRRAVWLAATGVCVGVLVVGVLRAREPSAAVWGMPVLNVRYLTVIAPAAMVLAALALEALPWRAAHLAAWGALGAMGAHWLALVPGDADPLRRRMTHILPLFLALALVALLAGRRRPGARAESRGARAHLAAAVAVACLAYGSAVTFGIDRVAVGAIRGAQDEYGAELRAIPERRFLLLGGYAMDHGLAVHDRREIRIVNLGMDPGAHRRSEARTRAWMDAGGAAYLIQDHPGGPWSLSWPGLRAVPLPGTRRVLRIERAPVVEGAPAPIGHERGPQPG